MSWVAAAVITAGAQLGGSYLSGRAAKDAAKQQARAAEAAAAQQREMFDILNQQQLPYREAGYTALNRINQLMGLPASYYQGGETVPTAEAKRQVAEGLFGNNIQRAAARVAQSARDQGWTGGTEVTPQTTPGYNAGAGDFGSMTRMFTAEDLKSNLAPNYQFMLGQGLGATRQSANVGGGGSNAQRAATKFAEDYASNAYQQALQNYTGQQQNIFNRLSGIAQIGQGAQNQVQNLGQTTAANIGQLGIGAASALGAGQVGAANAYAGGLSNLGQAVAMPYMFGNRPGAAPAGGYDFTGTPTVNANYGSMTVA